MKRFHVFSLFSLSFLLDAIRLVILLGVIEELILCGCENISALFIIISFHVISFTIRYIAMTQWSKRQLQIYFINLFAICITEIVYFIMCLTNRQMGVHAFSLSTQITRILYCLMPICELALISFRYRQKIRNII